MEENTLNSNEGNISSDKINKKTPFEYIKNNYSNPKIKIIKRAWNNDNKIIFKTRLSRYQVNFDDDFNIIKSKVKGMRLIPATIWIVLIFFSLGIHENLPFILIIPIVGLFWIWYKEKKELVNNLQVFLDNKF